MELNPKQEAIAAALAPLIATARRDGKWLFHGGLSGPLWFTPDQLAAENANGKFLWGPVNWEPRDPQGRLSEAERRRDDAQAEVDRISAAING